VGCNCHDCNNTSAHEAARNDAIKSTKERNSSAFVTKVSGGRGHATGCHCKNSMCLKKYCECFQAGAYCATNCKCLSCQNFCGSQSLGSAKAVRSVEREKRRRGSPTSVAATVSASSTPTDGAGLGPVSFGSAGPCMPSTTRRSSMRVLAAALAATGAGTGTVIGIGIGIGKGIGKGKGLGFHDNLISFEGGLDGEPLLALEESPHKKLRLGAAHALRPPVYRFFGEARPAAPKAVALSCLDFLGNADLYSMSLVSTLWARAAMDEALWAPAGCDGSAPLPL